MNHKEIDKKLNNIAQGGTGLDFILDNIPYILKEKIINEWEDENEADDNN